MDATLDGMEEKGHQDPDEKQNSSKRVNFPSILNNLDEIRRECARSAVDLSGPPRSSSVI